MSTDANNEMRKRDEDRRRRLANAREADATTNATLFISFGVVFALLLGGFIFAAKIGSAQSASAGSGSTSANATATAAANTSANATATAAANTSANATATAAASTSANATATAAASIPATQGPLAVSLAGGMNAAQTTKSFQGPTTITVSGIGQTRGTRTSDAFYIFTDEHGASVTPYHSTTAYALCINGKPVDTVVSSIPAYSANHTYKFTFNAPGGPLTFGVCDSNYSDNTGSFTVTFS